MRKPLLMVASILFSLAACNSANKPTAANFTKAINAYLITHGQLCIPVGGQFPIDVPVSQPNSPSGIGSKLMALQRAGLLNETDTNAVVQSLANSLSLGPHKAEKVQRYVVSTEGQKYLKSVMTDFGSVPGFCYGVKQVDSIAHWISSTTVGSPTVFQVTYSYKVADLARWALRPDIQQQFSAVPRILHEAMRTNQLISVQLIGNEWIAR